MCRALLGSLISIIVLAAAPAITSDAIAGDAPPPAVGADTARVYPGKRTVKPAKPRAGKLSAAAAYEATRTDLPAAPLHARTPAPAAPDRPWTGFYIGANAGIAQ